MTIEVGTRVRINDNYASRTDTPEYQFGVALFGVEFAESARQAAHDAYAGKTGTVIYVDESEGADWPYDVQVDGEPEGIDGRAMASAEELDVLESLDDEINRFLEANV